MKVTSVFIIAAITNSAQASGVARMTKVSKTELRSKAAGQKEASAILSKTPKVGATKEAKISKATKGTPGTIAKASKTTAKASKIGLKAEKIVGKASKNGKASKAKDQPSDPIDPVNRSETEVPTSKPTQEDKVPAGGTPKTSSPTESPAVTDEPSPQPSDGSGCGGPACPTSNPTMATQPPSIIITPFPTMTPVEPCPPGEDSTSLPSMEPSISSSSSPSESSSSSPSVTVKATRSPVTITSAPSDVLSLEPTFFVSPEPTLAVVSPGPITNTPTVQTGGDTLEPTLLETNVPTGGVNEEDGSTLLDTLMPTSSFDNIPLTPTFYPTMAPSCDTTEEEDSAAMDVPSAKLTPKPSVGWIAAPALPPITPFPSESPIVVTDDPGTLSANLLLEDTSSIKIDKVDAKDTSEVIPGIPRMSMPNSKASKVSKAHLRNMSMSISSSLLSAHGRALLTSKTGKGVKGSKTTTPFAKTKKEKQASIEDVENIAHSILITGVVTKPKSDKSATNEDVNLLQAREKPFRHAKMAKYAK